MSSCPDLARRVVAALDLAMADPDVCEPVYVEVVYQKRVPAEHINFTLTLQEEPTMAEQRIAWVDVETTGLDHGDDRLLEVACVVTDLQGKRVADAEPFNALIRLTPEAWARMFARGAVVAMHTESGLIRDLFAEPYGEERHTVLNNLRSYLHEHAGGAYLGGFSVHFDRRFLEANKSDVLEALSHRHVDVTTLEIALKAAGRDGVKGQAHNDNPHRALNDCHEAIDAYRVALTRLFK